MRLIDRDLDVVCIHDDDVSLDLRRRLRSYKEVPRQCDNPMRAGEWPETTQPGRHDAADRKSPRPRGAVDDREFD